MSLLDKALFLNEMKKGKVKKENNNKNFYNKGFTLVEMLVVIAITLTLSTIAVTYNRSSERQLITFRSQAEVVGVINRAKALALERFNDPVDENDLCGFGVNFQNDQDFLIYQDLETPGNCANSDNRYSGSEEDFQSFSLGEQVSFTEEVAGGLDILFISPHLDVVSSDQFPVEIGILSSSGEDRVNIFVSAVGQVSIQEVQD